MKPDEANEVYGRAWSQWVAGDWKSLAFDPRLRPDSSSAPSRIRILAAAAFLQLNKVDEARKLLSPLGKGSTDDNFAARILISGVHNSLGKAQSRMGNEESAREHFDQALKVAGPEDLDIATMARTMEQLSQIGNPKVWCGISSERRGQRVPKSLFVDCGGYDGCSVIKYLLHNPGFEVVTFEANPDLWEFYDGLPATLIKKAVSTNDGTAEFLIDPIDADGSSLIREKRIDFLGRVENRDCPVIEVQCEDLSRFVKEASLQYGEIVLKLDIEGAEYDILEKMLAEGTLGLVSTLYCEFHWKKMGMSKDKHDALVRRIRSVVGKEGLKPWDAQELSCYRKGAERYKVRGLLLQAINEFKKFILTGRRELY